MQLENYFGDNIHFKTFEEYTSQEETQENESIDGTSSQEPNYWKLIKTENDMDVFFTFQVRSGLLCYLIIPIVVSLILG